MQKGEVLHWCVPSCNTYCIDEQPELKSILHLVRMPTVQKHRFLLSLLHNQLHGRDRWVNRKAARKRNTGEISERRLKRWGFSWFDLKLMLQTTPIYTQGNLSADSFLLYWDSKCTDYLPNLDNFLSGWDYWVWEIDSILFPTTDHCNLVLAFHSIKTVHWGLLYTKALRDWNFSRVAISASQHTPHC